MAMQPSPELQALFDAAAATPPPSLPRPWPAPAESEDDWAAAVSGVRRQHEQWASDLATAAGGRAEDALLAVGSVRDVRQGTVKARLYTPPGDGPFPALLLIHGGGFWIGGGDAGLAASEPSARLMCVELGAVVVDVDYRQAPEHRFPIPLEDCYDTACWVAEHADELGVDRDRLAVAGPSAGANLCLGLALLLRDRAAMSPRLLMLMVPITDATMSSPSLRENGRYDITEELVGAAWDFYLGPTGDREEPLASLLHHPDLRGLPPTHVVVGEFDALRDDGLRLADRLADAGVDVTVSRLPMGHGVATPDVGEEYLRSVLARLSAALSE